MLLIAVAATPVVTVVQMLPRSYLLALVGLALLAPVQLALGTAFGGALRFGAMVAFVVAATPLTVAGATSAVWAIPVGLVASLLTERDELLPRWCAPRSGATTKTTAVAWVSLRVLRSSKSALQYLRIR
jgi:hypothetical protein